MASKGRIQLQTLPASYTITPQGTVFCFLTVPFAFWLTRILSITSMKVLFGPTLFYIVGRQTDR